MSRCVFSVATNQFVKGQDRLAAKLEALGERRQFWRGSLPLGSPSHQVNPYGFKAHALTSAYCLRSRPTTLLWCDSCILPIRPLGPVWEKIERDGYFFIRNGFENYQWTANSTYPILFPVEHAASWSIKGVEQPPGALARATNRTIQHVVGGCFGLSLLHPKGREFLSEFQRLCDAGAFVGPWTGGIGVQHRHDQTASSVIAWRLGMKLTDAPEIFAYAKYREDGTFHVEDQDERTILCAEGKIVG